MDIKEVIIDEEKLYLKKGKLGWAVVQPIKIDGKINWKNLLIGGSWIKFGITVFIILIILGCVYEYSQALTVANECLNKTYIFQELPARTLPAVVLP